MFGAAKTNGIETQVIDGSQTPERRTHARATTEIVEDSSADVPAVAPAAATRAPARHAGLSAIAHGLRVLMVDDSDIVRKVTGRMLEKLGCLVDYATNGSEAVRLCGTAEYDLVLMDCQMPEMDGYEATQRIRRGDAGSHHRDIRIIALTAAAMVGDRERCLDAGMTDYLTKPIQAPEIIRVINATIPSA